MSNNTRQLKRDLKERRDRKCSCNDGVMQNEEHTGPKLTRRYAQKIMAVCIIEKLLSWLCTWRRSTLKKVHLQQAYSIMERPLSINLSLQFAPINPKAYVWKGVGVAYRQTDYIH